MGMKLMKHVRPHYGPTAEEGDCTVLAPAREGGGVEIKITMQGWTVSHTVGPKVMLGLLAEAAEWGPE